MGDHDLHVPFFGVPKGRTGEIELLRADAAIRNRGSGRRGIKGHDHGVLDSIGLVQLVRDILPVESMGTYQPLDDTIQRHVVIAGHGDQRDRR